MRERRSVRLDLVMVERARERAGLPADAPLSAVIRYALAEVAGADTGPALDSTPGRGSMTYRDRVRAA